jgi:hypothetical protein
MENLKVKLSAKGEAFSRKFAWELKANTVYPAAIVHPDGKVVVLNHKGAKIILLPVWFDAVTE